MAASFSDPESVRTEQILRRFNQVFLTRKAACIGLWSQIATAAGPRARIAEARGYVKGA